MPYFFSLLLLFFAASPRVIFAQDQSNSPLRVAVAANAREALEEIATHYTAKTGQKVDFISGASGQLAVQIQNGAPYDLFFSADRAYAEMLVKAGKTQGATQHYATGRLVLWSSKALGTESVAALLEKATKIAIPDARFAPYGKAAECYLRSHNLWEKHKSKFIYGRSVSQTNRFIATGAVSLGFTARAAVKSNNKVSPKNYRALPSCEKVSLAQHLVQVKQENTHTKAKDFLNFVLKNKVAKSVWEKYGYSIP